MSTTRVTSNVLASGAAVSNINSGDTFNVSVPTAFTNTVTANSSVIGDNTIINPKLLITVNSNVGIGDEAPLVIKGSGINRAASINLRSTGGSAELYNGWITGRVGGGLTINSSLAVNNGNSGPQTGTTSFIVNNSGNVGIGTTTPSTRLHTLATTEQLRVGYDNSNYLSTTVGSTGMVTLDAVGTSAGFRFNDNIGIGTNPNSTYDIDAVGVARSGFRFTSGTRSLAFSNFAADVNYLSTNGAAFRIITTDANSMEFWTTNTRRFILGREGNAHMGTSNSISTNYQLSIQPTISTNIGLVVRGFTSQTANLTEWQDSAGVVLASVTASGNISATGTVSGSNLVYNTGDQPIAGTKTFSDNIVGNGASNRLPNQTASTGDAIITRDLLGLNSFLVRDLFSLSTRLASGTGATARRSQANGLIDGDLQVNTPLNSVFYITHLNGSLEGSFDLGKAVFLNRKWVFFNTFSFMSAVNAHTYMAINAGNALTGIPTTGNSVGFEVFSSTQIRLWKCVNGSVSYSNVGTINAPPNGSPAIMHNVWLECTGTDTLNLYLSQYSRGAAPTLMPATPICTLSELPTGTSANNIITVLRATGTVGSFVGLTLTSSKFIDYPPT